MITLYHLIRVAARNLRRGGQRVLVALLCIAFGITALTAMTTIAKSVESVLMVEPAQLLGGDLGLGREGEDYILPAHVAQLESLRQTGAISRYTLIAHSSSIVFHAAGSGETYFAGNGMGVEPDKYPLAGALIIREPGSTGLPVLLRQVGDVVITRDIALQHHFAVGDAIVLADARVGNPVPATVRGIAGDTPNHQGDKIYYTLETAQKLANGQPVINTAMANTPHPQSVAATLESSGWSVDWVAGRRTKQTGNLWVIGLRGAGILGLLVGGIGIANTMQVLLRRRQREIAVWKTLGYRDGHLRLLFALEAGLLGLAGSLLGAGLGVLISGDVLELFRRTSSVLYEWRFYPASPLLGVLVGTLATVIFACWAIVVSGQARPMALLRSEPVDVRRLPGCQAAGLALLLAVPFTALTALVMESVAAGIGVLVAIVAGTGTLGGFFSAVLWLCARALPLSGVPLARMGLRSLHRRGAALVFAMIALFVGVICMSTGLVVTQLGESRLSASPVAFRGYNLDVLSTPDQEPAIRAAVQAQDPEKVAVGYRTSLAGLTAVGGGPVDAMDPVLVGRSDPSDYVVSGAAWGSEPGGVYAYQGAHLPAGSRVEATFRDGTRRAFAVVGTYEINYDSIHLHPPFGLLLPAEDFARVARPDSFAVFVQVDPGRLARVASALGAALPQATVVDLVAYAGRFMQSYRNLFLLPMAVAGLALLAGLLLVANSVSLAMLDRRYEIGILKATGYSQRQVLAIFMVEYGLAGLLATIAGVLVVQLLLAALAIGNHLPPSALLLNARSLAVIAFGGVGLTLLAVFGVTWEPARVSPVVVLSEAA